MGKKVALLIGVGRCQGNNEKFPALQCPENGVAELEAILRNPDIGGFEQVESLVNPDLGTLQRCMGEFFTYPNVGKDDLVLLYFTGHGIKDMGGDFYLTTADTTFIGNRVNAGTAVPGSFVQNIFRNCYAQRKVIILDCCFGAAFAEGFLTMDDGSVDVEADLGGEGWVVLTAATARNYALEQEGEPLSVYTRYLVEGLKTGAAADEGAQTITVRQLHGYVREKVQVAAPTMEPSIFNGYQGDGIALARAVINPELTYRQKVKTKIRQGRIAPAGRQFLQDWRQQLGILPERASEIEAEVLKPFAEKQRHLNRYAQTLREEIEEEFPLSSEAIQDLQDLQKLWNLRDEDIKPILNQIATELNIDQNQVHFVLTVAKATPPAPLLTEPNLLVSNSSVEPQSEVKPVYPIFSFEVVTVNEKGEITERQRAEAEYRTEDLGNGVKLELVRVPSGKFQMGAPEDEEKSNNSERPQHWVTVPGFWMGKFPVTQAQYQVVTGKNPSRFSRNGANHPVEQVSWVDAIAFCEKLTVQTGQTYRLPSEAEWEYACRARTTTPFHFGITITPDLANYASNKPYGFGPIGKDRNHTTEVGSFLPNAFGLYDMHGNVLEWCLDHWHSNYQDAPTDATAWLSNSESSHKILRGGSWLHVPGYCRSAFRITLNQDSRGLDNLSFGFRVMC